MYLTNQIHTSKEGLQEFLNKIPSHTPLTMVNIIKFKERVEEENQSGEEIYNRYGMNVLPFLKKVGGKLIWRGKVHHTLIGDSEDQPDLILLVAYPSKEHFMKMVSDEGYQEIARDRTVSIEYGGLLVTTSEYNSL